MNSAPYCQAPDGVVRSPRFKLPEGATDCHAHICGPVENFPYWSERIYTPPDALMPQYQAMLGGLGVSRAVIVQPSVYSDDNRAMLAALATNQKNLRGVAVVKSSISDSELAAMHEAGVRGIRCNIVDLASAKGQLPIEELHALANRIAPLKWHLELLMHVNEFPLLQSQLGELPVDLVFGHYGYAPTGVGIADAGFQALLALMKRGKAWVKFTGPYRISSQRLENLQNLEKLPPYEDVRPFAQALIDCNPSRIVWGTDWPHVMVKGAMPNDADLCNLLGDWVGDASLREQILVRNPAQLYGF
jgi:2-pyrone-4,6-dicarboxylate lactonase